MASDRTYVSRHCRKVHTACRGMRHPWLVCLYTELWLTKIFLGVTKWFGGNDQKQVYSISSFMAMLIARHPKHVTISGDDTAIQLGRWLRWYIRYLTITFMLWMFFSLCSGSSVGGGFTLMLYTGFLLVIVWVVQCLITTYYWKGHNVNLESLLLITSPYTVKVRLNIKVLWFHNHPLF